MKSVKRSAKVFFGFSCLLLAISITFFVYSYAAYVSERKTAADSSVAKIECSIDVDRRKGSFINAPFLQQVQGDTRVIRMNDWSESTLTVRNNGRYGLKYSYSFVFYLPTPFVDRVMFQMLEHYDPTDVREDEPVRLQDAKKASALYCVDIATGALAKVTSIADGGKELIIENDYAELLDTERELKIDTATSTAVLQAGTQAAAVEKTFGAQYLESKDGVIAGKFACPVTVTDTESFAYYRVTVNLLLDADSKNEYILEEGKSKSFELRTVLLHALDPQIFAGYKWSNEKYADQTPQTPTDDFKVRWNAEKTALEIAEKADDNYHAVEIGTCLGVSMPCRVSAVFTQEQ